MKNEDVVILPVKYPPITSYGHHAHLLSVILNHNEVRPWLFNYYTQIEFTKGPTREGFIWMDFYNPYLWESCPWISHQRLHRSFINEKWSSFSEFIQDSIKQGYYILAFLDHYYIPDHLFYNNAHKKHDCFIYGFDKKNKKYKTANFLKNWKYTFSEIDFTQMCMAYVNEHLTNENYLQYHHQGITLMDYREKAIGCPPGRQFKFDVELLDEFLKDYLYSRNTRKRYALPARPHNDKPTNFGISVYERVIEYLRVVKDDFCQFQFRPIIVLLDHKIMMYERIKFLRENKYLGNADVLIEKYSHVVKEIKKLKNMWLLYYIKKDVKILDNIKDLVSDLYELEFQYTKEISNNLTIPSEI